MHKPTVAVRQAQPQSRPLKQKTLHSLRLGKQRMTRSVTRRGAQRASDDSDDDGNNKSPSAKRIKPGHSDEVNADDDGKRSHALHEENTDDDKATGGTTTDASALVPVTRAAFLDAYHVRGLSDVYYCPDWIPGALAHAWLHELDALPQWYRPTLRVYGRELRQSRAIAAFATSAGVQLQYSGHQVTMHAPFPPVLERIAARLARDDCLGREVKFNHCMLNRYDDGEVYIGKHSDNMENKVIVTVSLGAERTWVMEEKVPRGSVVKGQKHRWTLSNGSILVMQGDAQQRYTHEIPKERKVKDPRISITFRQLTEK